MSSEGQGGLACCSPWGCKESDTTERLKNNNDSAFKNNFNNWLWMYPFNLCTQTGEESTCNVGDLGLTLTFGRSPGEGEGYQLQYSGLENYMNCIVRGVAKS